MKALQPDVLLTALGIQDELLGPTIDFDPRKPWNASVSDYSSVTSLSPDMRDNFHAVNGVSNTSWFFHSPLQYWSCSSKSIAEDKDIITTVNENSHQSTSVNVTLRHSIVFSGKRFEDHRLVAADALVITLVHMLDSPVGQHWERNAEELAKRNSGRWRLYPSDGRSRSSTLYEFRFQPLSLADDLGLGIMYTCITLYFIYNLSRFRALKSKLGLVSAVVAQIAVSIMSSFTICAIFKIDLSKLPRAIYPIVVLAVGVENTFRLINAVIVTPSGSSSAARMGEALGQTGHIALAGFAQNLAIIWIISRFANPGVQAMCAFAAIALAFDYFFLLTFFVAVLSIDVRRLELSDSLTRTSAQSQRYLVPKSLRRKTWVHAVLQGEAPLSTRIAGTIIMVSFILTAQWHFFENESFSQTVSRIIRHLKSEPHTSKRTNASLLSVDVHQARTPTAWLKMQDHETAHEVINIIKPKGHSYIARVFDPLVFVLDGSDRTPTSFGVQPFLPAAYDFARHQSTPFIIILLLFIAGVSLLMNYLLWNELPGGEEDDRPEDDPLLSLKTLSHGHALDVVLLKASGEGVVASVGLDRRIRVWDIRRGGVGYIVHDPESDIDPFPVLAMAIDSDSNWLALLSRDFVSLWNIPEKRWGPTIEVEVKGRTPAAFFFGYSQGELIDPVVLVRNNGWLTELHVESGEKVELRVCKTPLVCVRQHIEPPITQNAQPPPIRVITSSRSGCVHIATRLESGWISEEVPCVTGGDDVSEVISILPLPALSSFLAVRNHTVDLIDAGTRKVTHTFSAKPIKADTLRCFHSTRRRPQCGSVGLSYLALAYTNAETGECILQTYLPEREGDTICFRDPWTPGSKTCCLWKETKEFTHVVENPGNWEALPVGYAVGVRKSTPPPVKDLGHHLAPTSGLRRRGRFERRTSADLKRKGDEDLWEVWSLSMRGERASIPLNASNENSLILDHLLVTSLGPIEKVGKRSLAVGLGNVIKVITVGNDRFDEQDNAIDDSAFVGMTASRRKKVSFAARRKT